MKKTSLISLLLIFSFCVDAQIHQPPSLWGKRELRTVSDSAMQGPTGNGAPTASNKTSRKQFGLYFDSTNFRFYIYIPNLNIWDTMHVGAVASPITVSNGLTLSSGDVKLGGTLNQSTTIITTGQEYQLYGANGLKQSLFRITPDSVVGFFLRNNSSQDLAYAYVNGSDSSLYLKGGRPIHGSGIALKDSAIIMQPPNGKLHIDSIANAKAKQWLYWNPSSGLVSAADTTAGGAGLTGLTSGYLTKATSSTSIDSSGLYQNAGKFGIGTTNPLENFDIRGGLRISRDFYDSSNAAIKLVQIGTNTSSTLLKYTPSNVNTDVFIPSISMIAQSAPGQNLPDSQSNYTFKYGLNINQSGQPIDTSRGSISAEMEAYFRQGGIGPIVQEAHPIVHGLKGGIYIRPITYAGAEDPNSIDRGVGFTSSRIEFASLSPGNTYDVYMAHDVPSSNNTVAPYYRINYNKPVVTRAPNGYTPFLQKDTIGTYRNLLGLDSNNRVVIGNDGFDNQLASNALINRLENEYFLFGKSNFKTGGIDMTVTGGPFLYARNDAYAGSGSYAQFAVNANYLTIGNNTYNSQITIHKDAPNDLLILRSNRAEVKGVDGSGGFNVLNSSSAPVIEMFPGGAGDGFLRMKLAGGSTNISLNANGNNYFNSYSTGFGTTSPDSLVTINTGLRVGRGVRFSGMTAGTLSTDANGTVTAVDSVTQRKNLNAAIQYGASRLKYHVGNGNGTGVSTFGWTVSAVGTATAVNVATTNRYTQAAGIEYLVTVASTTAIAGFRESATQNFLGNTTGSGGFTFICRFGPATGVATATKRSFTGMGSSAAAPTDVNPSTIVNQIGVGWDNGDANIQFISNDGTGSGTKVDLGIPVPTVDRTSFYELKMFALPNSSSVNYTFRDLSAGGSTVSGTVTTDLPAANTLLASKGWISAGGTSSVIGYKLASIHVESDF